MGVIRVPKPVKLVMSIIASDPILFAQVKKVLAGRFGEIDYMSDPLPFEHTDYYAQEMGERLTRCFCTFAPLIAREELVRIKHQTNEIEGLFAAGGKRRVNIDPGYICAEHLILATTKGYTHRPYLGEGIYADLTLIYRDGGFRPLEWTYPDYASAGIRGIMEGIRGRYLDQLKGGGV